MPPTDDNPPCILVMDANVRNAELLSDFLEREGYERAVVTELDTADDMIAEVSRFDFAIVDIDRFESPVWPYCERLHEDDIPFVLLSGLQTPSLQQKSREFGARSFLNKPIPQQELRELLKEAISS